MSESSLETQISVKADTIVGTVLGKPYGGMDWVQTEGWPIRQACKRTIEYAIWDAVEVPEE